MKSTRKLQWGDTFRLSRIIRDGNITPEDILEIISAKDELQKEADAEKTAEGKARAQKEMGVKLVCYVVDKFPACEASLNSFLANMAGVKTEVIERAEITEIIELIKDIFDNNKNIGDFFTRAFRSADLISST